MTSEQKQENYIHLKSDLKKAIGGKFWLEACMIEYAIIEDRTSSILHHSGVCKDAYSSSKKLSNKLNSIEHQIGKKHPIISKKVSLETINKIREWKELRNAIVHSSCNRVYNREEFAEVALEGNLLVNAICNDSKKVTILANKISARGKEEIK